METFGRNLAQAMKAKGLRYEEVARATGLDIEHILALGRNDFGALPSDHLVEQGLRAFARLIEADADQVIADFRRQRQSASQPQQETSPTARRSVVIPVLIILAGGFASFLFWPRESTAPAPGMATAEAKAPPARKEGTGQAVQRQTSPPLSRPIEPTPTIRRAVDVSGISIDEHGIGTAIINHELVGEQDRFAEGERVFFWTRIEGASAGDTIDHVWIHNGVEVHRVQIRVGSRRWRAHSYKRLNAGSSGEWAVEARDQAGQVLARSEFSCSRH